MWMIVIVLGTIRFVDSASHELKYIPNLSENIIVVILLYALFMGKALLTNSITLTLVDQDVASLTLISRFCHVVDNWNVSITIT